MRRPVARASWSTGTAHSHPAALSSTFANQTWASARQTLQQFLHQHGMPVLSSSADQDSALASVRGRGARPDDLSRLAARRAGLFTSRRTAVGLPLLSQPCWPTSQPGRHACRRPRLPSSRLARPEPKPHRSAPTRTCHSAGHDWYYATWPNLCAFLPCISAILPATQLRALACQRGRAAPAAEAAKEEPRKRRPGLVGGGNAGIVGEGRGPGPQLRLAPRATSAAEARGGNRSWSRRGAGPVSRSERAEHVAPYVAP